VPRAGFPGAARLLEHVDAPTDDPDTYVRALRKLALLAIPFRIRIAYEALSWGRRVNEMPQARTLPVRARRVPLT
jgi:hypothetical protein